MVWLQCDGCGDTVKKPKLVNHFRGCNSHSFTCVDCSRTFDRASAQQHNACVTEHDKYVLGATKPGGYAAAGCFDTNGGGGGGASAPTAGAAAAAPDGLEFLSTRPPWACRACGVACTSRATLEGHAAGVKHRRKVRAARAAVGGEQAPAQGQQEQAAAAEAATTAAAAEPSTAPQEQGGDEQQQEGKEKKKEGKDKVNKSSKKAAKAVLPAVVKKLHKKGKLSFGKLRKLVAKHLSPSPGGDTGAADAGAVLEAVKAQLAKQPGVEVRADRVAVATN